MAIISNRHRAPQSQWRKWSETARRVFNEVYRTMHENQWIFLHPQQGAISARMWRTVAWNAAWLAADAVIDDAPAKGLIVKDYAPGGRLVRSRKVA